MRTLLALAVLALVPVTAHAHPGGHQLTCTSHKGAKQSLKIALSRSNGQGFSSPTFTITVGGTDHTFTTDDVMQTFGTTTHDAPLGIIIVTADNSADTKATAHGSFTVTAIPSTVKALDRDGKPVKKWKIADEDDACHDANGKATFSAVFRGGVADEHGAVSLDAQILDCELDYDGGMAC